MNKLKAIYILFSLMITTGILTIFLFFIKNQKTKKKMRILSASLFIKMTRVRCEIIGSLQNKTGLILANHQSYLDIIAFESFVKGDLCWIAKEELKKLPYFGNAIINTDMIFVKRGCKESLPKMISDAKDRLAKNRIITVFPEGTRNNGNQLLKFKKGPKFLIKKLNTTFQPLIILNTKAIFDSKNIFHTENKTIKYIFLKPYKPDFKQKDWYEQFEEYYNKEYIKYKKEDDKLYS